MPLTEDIFWYCIMKPKDMFCVIILTVYLFLLLPTLIANDQNSVFVLPNGEVFVLQNKRKKNKRDFWNFLI